MIKTHRDSAFDFEAEITFLSTEAGGRRSPVADGYRGQLFFDNCDSDAQYYFCDKEWVQPGEAVISKVLLGSPELHFGRVRVGMPFLIREGLKTVAYGVVRAVVDLKASAAAPHGT